MTLKRIIFWLALAGIGVSTFTDKIIEASVLTIAMLMLVDREDWA